MTKELDLFIYLFFISFTVYPEKQRETKVEWDHLQRKYFRIALRPPVSWRKFDAWHDKHSMQKEYGNLQRQFSKVGHSGCFKLEMKLESEISFP